jgi:hypothetical protein
LPPLFLDLTFQVLNLYKRKSTKLYHGLWGNKDAPRRENTKNLNRLHFSFSN